MKIPEFNYKSGISIDLISNRQKHITLNLKAIILVY